MKGSLQGGTSEYGDGDEFRAKLSAGTSFGVGRGHIVASGSHSHFSSIDRVDSRLEAFGEVLVPVFADSALGNSLDVNAAIHLTDYSTSGMVNAWKVDTVYDIAGGFKLSGAYSRDIRAHNLSEYFLGGSTTSVSVVDGANGGVAALRIQSGNVNLEPELANTLTLGAVFQPVFLPGALNWQTFRHNIRLRLDEARRGRIVCLNVCAD